MVERLGSHSYLGEDFLFFKLPKLGGCALQMKTRFV